MKILSVKMIVLLTRISLNRETFEDFRLYISVARLGKLAFPCQERGDTPICFSVTKPLRLSKS